MATTLLILGLVATIGGIVVFAVSSRLVATMLLAFGALAAVTGWLLPITDRVEALKTGGLAAGSVVALYALWLNDRRRRVDEQRHALEDARQRLESDRAAYERERAADDRFLRAVELLGHETDQARVGALHALVGVARSRPAYTQDVLDVICSYLRRPFDHPEYASARAEEYEGDSAEADRWRVVRLAAQRCLADLLPRVGTEGASAYNLDLTGATLEYCDLSYRVMGEVRLRAMKLYQSNSFHHCEVHGPAWFTNTETWGRLHLRDMVFHADAVFSRVRAHNSVLFDDTDFRGAANFVQSTFDAKVDFHDTRFATEPGFTGTTFTGLVTPPAGWTQDGHRLTQP